MRRALLISLLVGLFLLLECVNGCRRRRRSHPPPRRERRRPSFDLPYCYKHIPVDCNSSSCVDSDKKLFHGVHLWMPRLRTKVLCEGKTDGGGWVVFQRRWGYNANFTQGWENYTKGFGIIDDQFWWGNENLHLFTKQRTCELYIIMESSGRVFHERFTKFRIEAGKKYILRYDKRIKEMGRIGWDALKISNGETFSTFDEGYDWRCANNLDGGWWYKNSDRCTNSMLNGRIMLWGHFLIQYSQMMVRCYRKLDETEDLGPIRGMPVCHKEVSYDCGSSCIDSSKKLFRGTVGGMPLSRSAVLCDGKTDGGGWVVFQRRWNYAKDFNRNWDDYRDGFGVFDAEFWWGNDNLYLFTKSRTCELHIIMESNNRVFHERFAKFRIEPEDRQYKLHYDKRIEMMGRRNQITDAFAISNGETFSTFDKGWDWKCAKVEGGGWWYKKSGQCAEAVLNNREMFWGRFRRAGRIVITYSQMMVRCNG